MLYATTRNKHDVVTPHKTVHEDCSSEGGLYAPFQMPVFAGPQLHSLLHSTPSQIVAEVLNLLFNSSITQREVEQLLARRPIRLPSLSSRLMVLEAWDGISGDIIGLIKPVSDRLRHAGRGMPPTNWVEIAVRISLLFCCYGSLMASGRLSYLSLLDVAFAAGDFSGPMAAWYARQMGLPVGTIICGCNANGSLWDLLNRGEFPTGDRTVPTATPEADVVIPRNLERLICAAMGVEETQRFLYAARFGRIYQLPADKANRLRSQIFAAVISDSRMVSTVYGVYRNRGYVLGPYGALAYSSLMDYRAMTGVTRTALLFAERSPAKDTRLVGRILGLQESEIKQRFSR